MTPRLRIVGGLLIATALVTLDVVLDGPLTHLDRHVMLWVDVHQRHGLRRVADDVSTLGRASIAVPVLVVALVAAAFTRRLRRAAWYAVLTVAVLAVTVGLRVAVGRSSPTFGPHVGVGGRSFPSGHVVLLTLAMGAVALAVGRRWALWCAAVVSVAVAAARVYDFAHFPTDVVAALLLAGVPVAWTWKSRSVTGQRSPA